MKPTRTKNEPNFDYKDMSDTGRPFTSNVYKKKMNSKGRQFYTDCLR